MKNILGHTVNLPSRLIQGNWKTYAHRYSLIEDNILTLDKNFDLIKKSIHTTGAYQLPLNTFKNKSNLTPLGIYFSTNKYRIVQTKTKVLLRGLNYYPGLLTSISLAEKCDLIIAELNELVNALNNIDETENIILFLGAIDNLKNYLLIVLNAIDVGLKNVDSKNYFLSKINYFNLLNSILFLEYYQFKTILDKKIVWSKEILKTIEIDIYKRFCSEISSRSLFGEHWENNIIRKIRECSHPYKIINFAKVVSDQYIPSNTLLVSFAYGGMELPFAVNAFRMTINKSLESQIICSLSNYSTGSSNYVQDLDDSLPPFYNENYFQSFDKVLILDDSTTTGKTIQTFLDLYPKNIKEAFLAVVSFKNTNRYHHLIRPYHGGVNPEVLEKAIVTYTSNFTGTYKKFSYTNRQGVFDKEKQKIISLLKDYID